MNGRPGRSGSRRRTGVYAAFLRGVSPMNATTSALTSAFQAAGFKDVKTVLASGNVIFRATGGAAVSPEALGRKAEAGLAAEMGRVFPVIVRSIADLQSMLASDPFKRFRLPAGSKRVITFLGGPPNKELNLPVELGEARIVAARGTEVFTTYVPTPGNPVFMTLIERTFGKSVTTRTWETVQKVVRAAVGDDDR